MILCKLLKVGVDKTAQLAQKFVASGVWAFFHLFARTAAPRSASFPVRRSGCCAIQPIRTQREIGEVLRIQVVCIMRYFQVLTA